MYSKTICNFPFLTKSFRPVKFPNYSENFNITCYNLPLQCCQSPEYWAKWLKPPEFKIPLNVVLTNLFYFDSKKPKKTHLGFFRWVFLGFFGWVFRLPTLGCRLTKVYFKSSCPAKLNSAAYTLIFLAESSCICSIRPLRKPVYGSDFFFTGTDLIEIKSLIFLLLFLDW